MRPAEPGDEEFLRALFFDVRHAEFEMTGMPPEQLEPLLLMQYSMRKHSYSENYPTARSLIAVIEGEPAANLMTVHESDRIHLIDIAVLSKFRGRGIGRLLITRLKKETERITLTVFQTNSGAVRLYETLGFEETGRDGAYKLMEWNNA